MEAIIVHEPERPERDIVLSVSEMQRTVEHHPRRPNKYAEGMKMESNQCGLAGPAASSGQCEAPRQGRSRQIPEAMDYVESRVDKLQATIHELIQHLAPVMSSGLNPTWESCSDDPDDLGNPCELANRLRMTGVRVAASVECLREIVDQIEV